MVKKEKYTREELNEQIERLKQENTILQLEIEQLTDVNKFLEKQNLEIAKTYLSNNKF